MAFLDVMNLYLINSGELVMQSKYCYFAIIIIIIRTRMLLHCYYYNYILCKQYLMCIMNPNQLIFFNCLILVLSKLA